MNEHQTEQMIRELAEALKRMAKGPCCIALAGAHAKGSADSASDLDFLLVLEQPAPYRDRLGVIDEIADSDGGRYMSKDFDEAPYGGSIDFRYRGIPIEVTVRTFERLSKRVEECLAGTFEIIPQAWTSNGYYTFIYLSELAFVKPLWDPDGILAAYQEKTRPYPEQLRRAIIDCFWSRANTWLDNFHYDSAIARGDMLFAAPIVLHTILDMIQVIFALNRVYFQGDKKLQENLAYMKYCPKALLKHLTFLLMASGDSNILLKQRDLLREIRDELQIKFESEGDIT